MSPSACKIGYLTLAFSLLAGLHANPSAAWVAAESTSDSASIKQKHSQESHIFPDRDTDSQIDEDNEAQKNSRMPSKQIAAEIHSGAQPSEKLAQQPQAGNPPGAKPQEMTSENPSEKTSDPSSANRSRPAAVFQFLGPDTIADMVDAVSGAVVNIVSTSPMSRDQATRIRMEQRARDEGAKRMRKYFGLDVPSDDPGNQVRTTGAGVLIRSDGFILTSLHVVKAADQIKVTLKDGRSFEAKVMGRDSFSDLAVIKINSSGLPTVKFADAEKLRLGQWLVAIGNPYAYENSVTAGLVSGLHREAKAFTPAFGARTGALRFIQTDVPLNPGSSGGPLFNLNGEVVGINSFIRDEAQNIGFAIPGHIAQGIGEKLIKLGNVQHPYLGIEMRDPTEMPTGAALIPGVEVTKVKIPSPASLGGIEVGDLIVSIDASQVKQPSDVSSMISNHAAGERLNILVRRNGAEKTLVVKIENLPDEIE